MRLGVDVFMQDKKMQNSLHNKRLAYLGNHASVTENLKNAFEVLSNNTSLNWTCLFSPQHGWSIVEQANMIPSADGKIKNIPVFSLYTHKTRKITSHQMDQFDVLVVDLQDVGCRIYTFLTTVLYALKSCAENKKSVLILDRPNPVGRVVEGSFLHSAFQSVVGAWRVPMRYGLTLGEIAKAYVDTEKLDVHLKVIRMQDYNPSTGWYQNQSWILPSPNMTDWQCALCYSGTVLLEGTKISEGRGTTLPLKIFGFPKMKSTQVIKQMESLKAEWLKGVILRPCSFKPTFDKFQNQVCSAIQIHIQSNCEMQFRPYRLMSLFLKSVRKVHPDFGWLLPPPYEYEYEKWPIDILSGDSFLREWVDNPQSSVEELEKKLTKDESQWRDQYSSFFLYQDE